MARSIIATIIFSTLTLLTSAQEIKLLLEHLYFDEEIKEELMKDKWVGLFEQDKIFSMKNCMIQIEEARHPMSDSEEAQTGLKVTSEPSAPLLLISGVKATETLNSIELAHKDCHPGMSEQIAFSGQNYEISATATVVKDGFQERISNYQLALSNNGKTQILAKSDYFDDDMINVIWSGDMDGDKQLDFIIDLSYKYSFRDFALFLSSKAEQGDLVKLVSRHKVYND